MIWLKEQRLVPLREADGPVATMVVVGQQTLTRLQGQVWDSAPVEVRAGCTWLLVRTRWGPIVEVDQLANKYRSLARDIQALDHLESRVRLFDGCPLLSASLVDCFDLFAAVAACTPGSGKGLWRL